MLRKASALFALTLIFAPAVGQGAVYKCTVDGSVVFSDEPCGSGSERIEIDTQAPSGMRLDSDSDIEFYQAPERRRSSAAASCPHINSTKLNTLTIRNEIVRGMKPASVRKSWGSPTSVNTGTARTQWAYHWTNGSSSYVYFENGCVSSFSQYRRNY